VLRVTLTVTGIDGIQSPTMTLRGSLIGQLLMVVIVDTNTAAAVEVFTLVAVIVRFPMYTVVANTIGTASAAVTVILVAVIILQRHWRGVAWLLY
jgi:hypothetical protein